MRSNHLYYLFAAGNCATQVVRNRVSLTQTSRNPVFGLVCADRDRQLFQGDRTRKAWQHWRSRGWLTATIQTAANSKQLPQGNLLQAGIAIDLIQTKIIVNPTKKVNYGNTHH